MPAILDYTTSDELLETDTLRINLNKTHIAAELSLYSYIDDDTKQRMAYLPGLELTGYGDTKEQALELLLFSVKEYFRHLSRLSLDEIRSELNELGWKKNELLNKQYSKTYIDIDGQLKNLNAQDNKIERTTLLTAA